MSDSKQLPDPTVLETAPLCPWCGAEQGDTVDGDSHCGACGKPVTIESIIAIDYDAGITFTTNPRAEAGPTDCPKEEKS